MSEEIGEFVTADREPGPSSDGSGSSEPENGNRGIEGNGNGAPRIIDGFETWNPAGPATERIPVRESADGEPRRTKSGKIDRRTKAGRNATGTPETQNPVATSRKGLISLEQAILSLHDMAAGLFGIPEMSLSEPEAKTYNDVVLEVAKYKVAHFDPYHVAIFNAVTCIGGMYAVRIMSYRNRMAMERRSKLSVMPNNKPEAPAQPQGMTIEQYLGGNPPAEGAAGL